MTAEKGVSKQSGQTSSSLNWLTDCRTGGCKNCYCSGSCPKLSRRIGLKFGRPTRSKTRFKRCKWSQWKIRFFSPRIALNHQYLYRIEDSDTRSAEFRRGMHGMQPTWPHYRCRSEENEDRSQERCNNSGLLPDQKGRAVHSISFETVSFHRRRTIDCRPLMRTNCCQWKTSENEPSVSASAGD